MTSSQSPDIDFDIRPSDHRVPAGERERMMAVPGFGEVFTDHMVTIRWSAERGWHDGRLEAYGQITLDPATSVLHYGQEIFEGLKAYVQAGGPVVAFRPQANAARFNRSAARMAMPELPERAFVRAIELLVRQDRDWVPAAAGHSLYLRPFMIATERGLGVNRPSSSCLFTVIASPVADYFAGGVQPVSVWLSEDYTRAAPGGTGEAKCGGNYAAAFAGQLEALRNDCDQVVWLDAAEHRWVEEMGGMNLFFVYGSGAEARITTPAPTGTLLRGITRDSLLKLGPDLGRSVAGWLRIGRDHRGVRLRHGRGDHAGGRGQGRRAGVGYRRRQARPGHHAAARRAPRHPVRPPARPVRLDPPAVLARRDGLC